MKKAAVIIYLLGSCLLTEAQEHLAGQYAYANVENEERPFFNYRLNLNCDKTFAAVDSARKLFAKGTWLLMKNKKLILDADSIVFESKKINNHLTKLYVTHDGLHAKTMSRRQYKRMYKELGRGAGEVQHFEEYDKFKERQEKHYLKKIVWFDCR